jgi:hypothetical protein
MELADCASRDWIGRVALAPPPKAIFSEAATMRYLSTLIEEIAYITTKNASSSVIRSA